MNSNVKAATQKVVPFFGGFILETLTLGMYGESRNALREYVQNAYDSVLSARVDGTLPRDGGIVELLISENSLRIWDDGSGIPSKSAIETLTSIGASDKSYRKQAGFRGIGRLAGLVLCDSLAFRTKAKGEFTETVVTFDAKSMRHAMSPSRVGFQSLESLLMNNITATSVDNDDVAAHFFEVTMDGLHEPPPECTDEDQLIDFLKQVAPVPYDEKFIYIAEIARQAKKRNSPIDQIMVVVRSNSDDDGRQVFKEYGDKFAVEKKTVDLERIDIEESPTDHWWGWIGVKAEPGAYRNHLVRALRIRVRNIQIDGTQLMAKLFGDVEGAPSYARFNDWYTGEIFVVDHGLIPNARRDGFEENEAWLTAKAELIQLCRRLGDKAYDLSKSSQLSVPNLTKQTVNLETKGKSVLSNAILDLGAITGLAADLIKVQRKIARAVKDASLETAVMLRGLEARVLTLHSHSLNKLSKKTDVNASEIASRARKLLLSALIPELRLGLTKAEFSKVMQIIETVVGDVEVD